jgi:hypothetical protein
MPFIPSVDTDGDFLQDYVEDANGNGLVDAGETDPERLDTDGDSTHDGAEFILGLDPLDSNDFFAVQASVSSNGHLQLTWPSHPAFFFRSEASTDLRVWDVLADGIPGTSGASNTTHDAGPLTGGPPKYYRVKIR